MLYTKTAAELSSMLRQGQCSSAEIVREQYARIARVDGKVRAFLSLTEEQALKTAAELDGRRAGGEALAPLAGIPLGVKDNICTKDVATTCASRMLESFVPPYSATVMEKLEAAGAIPLGKLNLDEFAMGSSCENSYFQKTANPHDVTRVPGGSSGGSGAAVAAGMAPLSLGSDTGGSIRLPAAFCGVVGLKPTYGTVSRYGLVAFASSLDQIGPLGRSVADVAMLYAAICGGDDMDATSINREYPDFGRALKPDAKGKTIGIPKEYFGKGVDADVADAVMAAARALEGEGARLAEVSLPSTPYALNAYYIISSAEASSNLARFDGVKYGFRADEFEDLTDMYEQTRSQGFGQEVKRRIMLGTYVLSSGYYDAYYKRAKLLQQQMAEEFAGVFATCDCLLTPTSPTTAFKLGENLGSPTKMYAADVCTVTVNIAGLPALSVPCGRDGDGLPIGMQLIGPKFSEQTLLDVAHHYEQLTGGWNQLPEAL